MKDRNNIFNDDYLRDSWDSASPSIDKELMAAMRQAIDKEISVIDGTAEKHGYKRRKINRRTFIPLAACSVLLIVSLSLLFFPHSKLTGESQMAHIITEKGQKTSLILEDGTKVWLNCESELSYPSFSNAESRDVFLKGECYFEVAKDPDKPFTVHTDVYDVTAVGTAFNVRAYPSDNTVKTTLIEGKVLVSWDDIRADLLPYESITYYRENDEYDKIRDERSCNDELWRKDELYVEHGTTLYQLSRILERNYNYEFKFQDDKIKEYTFEGIIKDNQFTAVLELICLSAPVKYQIAGNQVVFSHK